MSETNTFSDWLKSEYAKAPNRFGQFADKSCRILRVRRSRWRGQRLIKGVELKIGEDLIPESTTTQPRWNLIPKHVRDRFDALEESVSLILRQYVGVSASRSKKPDDEDHESERGVLTGHGLYAVNAAVYPRVKQLLGLASKRWAEEADKCCTEDGYAAIVEAVKEKVGAALVEKVLPLLPDRHALRAKFDLSFFTYPVRFAAPDDQDEDRSEDIATAAVEALEAVVRAPRSRLAAACENFAGQLAERTVNGIVARKALRKDKESGQMIPAVRAIQLRSVLAVAEALDDFRAFQKFADAELVVALNLLAEELPDVTAARTACTTGDEDTARKRERANETQAADLARNLRDKDTEAARIGSLAFRLADLARDEAGMCAGVASAMKG